MTRRPYRPTAPTEWPFILACVLTGFVLGAASALLFVLWGLR